MRTCLRYSSRDGGPDRGPPQVCSTADLPGGTQRAHPGMILIQIPHVTLEIGHVEHVLSDRALLGCKHRIGEWR